MDQTRKLMYRFLMLFASIICFSNVFFLLPPYLERSGLAPDRIGWVVSSFYMATMIFRPLGGWLAEKLGFYRTMLGGALTCLVGGLLFVLMPHGVSVMISLRILMGVGFSAFMVAQTSFQTLAIPDELRGESFAVSSIGGMIPFFTVIPFADFLISSGHDGFYLWLPPLAVLFCILNILPLKRMSVEREGGGRSSGGYGEAFRDPGIRMLIASCFFFGLIDSSVIYISSLAVSRGLVPSWFLVPSAVGAISMRIFGRKFFNRIPRTAISAPSMALLSLFTYLATFSASNGFLAVCGFISGLGVGFGFPAQLAMIGDLAPAHLRTRASALGLFFMDLSWALMPIYMGYASSMTSVSTAFRIFSLFSLAVAAVLHFVMQRGRPGGNFGRS